MFIKYPHVERLGNTEVSGILEGDCTIFPKLDGTNASIWKDDLDVYHTGSRNREVTPVSDNAGFAKWFHHEESESVFAIKKYLYKFPRHVLYGEWLVPHTVKGYRDDAWRKFYVFDILNLDTNMFEKYTDYRTYLDSFGITYIPALSFIRNPTHKEIQDAIQSNNFLLKNTEGVGEGIVIKRYDYINKYGNYAIAKVISDKFKIDKIVKVQSNTNTVEEHMVDSLITNHLIEKTKAKVMLDNSGEWGSKLIPKVLGLVWWDFLKEELPDFINKYSGKLNTLNCNTLKRLVLTKVRNHLLTETI